MDNYKFPAVEKLINYILRAYEDTDAPIRELAFAAAKEIESAE